MKQIYARVVVGCGISPDYLLDEMDDWEIEAAMLGLSLKEREPWERVRMQSFIYAQINSSKELKMQDIIRFPWDVKSYKEEDAGMSLDDISKIEDIASIVERTMNMED